MQTINPLVVSVGPTAGTTPIYPIQPTEHGGGVKKVVAVAAAIIIPVAAPAIASSIAASGVLGASISAAMTTTAGAVVSSAITGAALGAVTAKVTGQSVKAGAIMGALGGGFGGYRSAAAGTFGTPQGGVSATADKYLGTNFSGQPTTGSDIGVNMGQDGQVIQTGGAQTDGTLVKTGTEVGGDAASKTFLEKLSEVPSTIVDKVTNPDTLANMTLMAGGQLLATALIPPGSMPELSAEEQQVMDQYKQELAVLKETNEAAFNAKMDAAKQYLVQAGYFSPEYFGLQAANKAAIESERKMREYRRTAGLTDFRSTGRNAAEERRFALESAKNVQSAYDTGFQKGMTSKDAALKTGYGMIPKADATYANALANLGNMYSARRGEADKQRENITSFFGRLATTSGNSSKDKKALEDTVPKDEKQINSKGSGLDTSSYQMV